MKKINTIIVTLILVFGCEFQPSTPWNCQIPINKWSQNMNIKLDGTDCYQDNIDCYCTLRTGEKLIKLTCLGNKCWLPNEYRNDN
jgi:hypothetical protein